MFNIPEELKKLPQKPGVYIMKDEDGYIIYVGKAINLRSRVRQYFQESSSKTLKVRNMVSRIAEFEYIVVDNEMEALILENNLIKENKPKYNILLKDDKTYPYIKVTLNEKYPRIYIVRKVLKDKAKYFGPYTNVGDIKQTIGLIHELWPIRRCQKKFPRDLYKERPCLYHYIGQCDAPCNGLISEEDYGKYINEAMQLLNGKYEGILSSLKKKMEAYSENLEFEKAAEVRDNINAVRSLRETQKIESASYDEQDVIAIARAEDEALAQIFFIRGGKITGREHFMLDTVLDTSREETMTAFLKQFYSETSVIPREIILDTDISEKDIITEWLSVLRGTHVTITVPQKGSKYKLANLAYKNASLTLNQFGDKLKRENERTRGALDEIEEALNADIYIHRIEAYDISNIQGYESVGSMVVFEGGKPKRSDYRKFKIKGVLGPNDYASIEEVIRRRFNRYINETSDNEEKSEGKFSTLPDILFIDGGKGQVGAALKALKELGIDIPVCGMIKDDRHRTRGLFFDGQEILMPYTSEGFKLITRIQDEVHRFAIEYHRKLRAKAQIKSVLDDIPGIGPVRRKALLAHFGSIEGIMSASLEELAAADGMNKNAAESVYNFFRLK